MGYRPQIEPRVIARMRRERDAGASLETIARRLNDDRVPTPHGKRWHHSTVRYALNSLAADPAAQRRVAESACHE